VFNTAMLRLLATMFALAVAALALPPAAGAATGSCLVPASGEVCTISKGKVTFIGDGDTIFVDVAGDGISGSVSVRLTGVNAAEQTVYSKQAANRRGECHALEATARLEALIRKSRGRVRLAALDPESRSRQRLRRSVAVRIGGRWRDVARRLLIEGHTLWLPNRGEYVWNRDYSVLAQRAAALGRGIWNPAHCGPGPSEGVGLQIWASWDADGTDGDFLNGEWIKVRNLDPVATVALGGWWVRDSQLRRYSFPSWATLTPGETITVYVGDGPDTWTELFWGLRRPAFENVTADERALGDGAYLFDPEGDLRASMMYPCRHACADPNVGAIQIAAKVRGREHITLRNVSAAAVDLATYQLVSRPYTYAFSRDAVLAPGEEMRIDVRGDPELDTRLDKHWGETGPILDNAGDTLRLRSFTDIEIGCYAYGDASC
jgi:endonuclease YncB( thermonuclease family)